MPNQNGRTHSNDDLHHRYDPMRMRGERDRDDDRSDERGWSQVGDEFSERDRSMRGRDEDRGDRGDRGGRRQMTGYGGYGYEDGNDNERMGYYGNSDQQRGMSNQGYQGYQGNQGYDRGGGESGRYGRSGWNEQQYGNSRSSWNEPQYGYGRERFEGRFGGGGGNMTGGGMTGGRMNQQQRGPHYGKGPSSFQRSDERIKEQVNEALTDHGHIDATHIDVQVKNGEVTLTGTVDDRQTKRLAEDCVEQVSGVVDVQNQIKVGSGGNGSERRTERGQGTETDKKHRAS